MLIHQFEERDITLRDSADRFAEKLGRVVDARSIQLRPQGGFLFSLEGGCNTYAAYFRGKRDAYRIQIELIDVNCGPMS